MMDRKTLLALILCLIIPIAWQKFVLQDYPQQTPVTQTAPQTQLQQPETVSQGTSPSLNQQPKPSVPVKTSSRPAKTVTLKTGTGDATIGDGQHFFVGWNLKSYKLGIAPQAAAVDMQSVTHQPGEVSLAFDQLGYLNDVQGNLSQTPNGAVWHYEDANIKLTREFSSTEAQPYVDVRVTAEFKSKRPNYAFVSLASQTFDKDPEAQDRNLIYFTKDSTERVTLTDVALKEVPTPVKYIAASNRYFLISAVASSSTLPNALVQPGPSQSAGKINMVYPISGNTLSIPLKVYFGPKELDILRKVDPTLDHTVDFGWFTVFAYPLLTFLKWLYQFFHNYGLAIIVLTVLLKVATYPLTYKSMKSMKKMAKMQPQLQRLREKHKDDKEALNREMLTLMKNGGYNPMAGCVPLLIQMPIFFALYRVLYSSIELYHAPFLFWIKDLSSHDPFYVTPVLLTGVMYVQQKLTPNTATDPAQAKMMQFMPVMFGAFMVSLPSGLTIYMLANALASVVQQLILNKKLKEA